MEKFSLKWDNFQTNFTNSFKKIKDEKDFFDVTLVTEDNQFVSAHKVVLAASSELFKNILKKADHSTPMIYLNGVEFKELSWIIDYIYEGETSIFQEDLKSFLGIAKKLKIEALIGIKEEDERQEEPLNLKSNMILEDPPVTDYNIPAPLLVNYDGTVTPVEEIPEKPENDHEDEKTKNEKLVEDNQYELYHPVAFPPLTHKFGGKRFSNLDKHVKLVTQEEDSSKVLCISVRDSKLALSGEQGLVAIFKNEVELANISLKELLEQCQRLVKDNQYELYCPLILPPLTHKFESPAWKWNVAQENLQLYFKVMGFGRGSSKQFGRSDCKPEWWPNVGRDPKLSWYNFKHPTYTSFEHCNRLFRCIFEHYNIDQETFFVSATNKKRHKQKTSRKIIE